tara:strand:- start:327 stop:644 length:318 start_codon:yes stop_codon:yes gene_type:complete
MESSDILLLIVLGTLVFVWISGEFFCRKSKDPRWINKTRGNMSVDKYSKSLGEEWWRGEDSKELREKKLQLCDASNREDMRIVFRVVPSILIFLILGVYIYHGGK